MENLFKPKFVLRKKSESPKELQNEKPTDEAVEPERLLSVQGADMSTPEASKEVEKEKAESQEKVTSAQAVREYTPSSQKVVGVEKYWSSEEALPSKQTSIDAKGPDRFRKYKPKWKN